MYGADRVQPVITYEDGKFIKKVTLHRFLGIKLSLSWRKNQRYPEEKNNAVGMSSGQTTIYEGYAKVKL